MKSTPNPSQVNSLSLRKRLSETCPQSSRQAGITRLRVVAGEGYFTWLAAQNRARFKMEG